MRRDRRRSSRNRNARGGAGYSCRRDRRVVVAEAEADRETEAEEEAGAETEAEVEARLLEAALDEAARDAELLAATEELDEAAFEAEEEATFEAEEEAAAEVELGAAEVVVVLAVNLPKIDIRYHPPHI